MGRKYNENEFHVHTSSILRGSLLVGASLLYPKCIDVETPFEMSCMPLLSSSKTIGKKKKLTCILITWGELRKRLLD